LLGINIIISGLKNFVKEGPLPQFYLLYCCKMLRRIFGHKRDDVTGEWRKLHNEELNGL
jgi:hypothetical protein